MAKRRADRLRLVKIERGFTKMAHGSVLISAGDTQVLCTASVVPGVPVWLKGRGEGWVTSEYAMLPGSTRQRRARRSDGRSIEIQRVIGRSMRAVTDRSKLGENTIWIDCDVLQADGGTRTAAITGSYVALHDAITRLREDGQIEDWPLTAAVAAVSVGVVDGKVVLDLDYELDSAAEVDMNVVMTSQDRFVEIQGTAERGSFDDEALERMLSVARRGIRKLFKIQEQVLRESGESGG